MIVRIYTGQDGQTHFEDPLNSFSLTRARETKRIPPARQRGPQDEGRGPAAARRQLDGPAA